MATIILSSINVVHALGLFCLLLLVHKGDAYEFVVGGQKGWGVPSDPNSNPYNQWAEKSRFQIGDSLVFNYPSGKDSVIPVNSEDYASCNPDAHSEKFSDGHTVFKLNQSGPHFFISGNKDNCLKNEKLVVIVLADRTNSTSNTNQTSTVSPSPSPSQLTTESPAPSPSHSTESSAPSPSQSTGSSAPSPSTSTGSSAPSPSQSTGSSAPSPAPALQDAASPPEGTVESNPTPAPVSEPPPPNAASSVLVSFAGSVGAFMASVLVFSL